MRNTDLDRGLSWTKRLRRFVGIQTSAQHFRDTAKKLLVFFPHSANFQTFPDLTYQSANRFPAQLIGLLTDVGIAETVTIRDAVSFADAKDAQLLGQLFDTYGSDKRGNEYHFVYADILEQLGRQTPLAILEIGLGTNDPKAVSTMGVHGRPGASLRAFRDYLPNSRVYGADVDRRILFREERITTAFVDQTEPETFARMVKAMGCSEFDLIIDDGLHSVDANLNTLRFGLKAIRPNGWIVIEDIPDRTLVVWRLVANLLARAGIAAQIVRGLGYLFVVTRGVAKLTGNTR